MADEDAFVSAHRQMAESDDFLFGLDFEVGTPWQVYLRHLTDQRHGMGLAKGWVPSTFLVADVQGDIVGRTSIRHELNDRLRREGGHIGYCVLPHQRRRGNATEILRQSIVIARSVGVDRVLVTCDDGNMASTKTIERCGGVLEDVIEVEYGPAKRRYWIE